MMKRNLSQFLTQATAQYQVIMLALVVLVGLSLLGWYSYLLFHILAELFSVIIAFTIFILTWNGRRFFNNGTVLFLGISFLFVATLDLVHTLAFKGMDIFPQSRDANIATHLWLSARFVQATALVIAPFMLRKRINPYLEFAGFTVLSVFLLVMAFGGYLPITNTGSGLTPFKVASEYVIIIAYLVGAGLLLRIKEAFDEEVIRLLVMSVLLNALAEFFFTQYITPYDFRNLLGHYFKIISFYMVYKAIIETGFLKPHDLLFRELKQSEMALRESEAREHARAGQLEAIMEAVPAVVWIAHDPQARMVTGNQAAADLLRMPPDANASKTAPDGEAPEHFRVYKDGVELVPEELPLQISAATGQFVRDFEEKIVFDDGKERHLLGNVTPLLSDSGQPMGAVAAFIDISERVQAEQALQESEQRYRGLFETMAEGFVLVEVIYNEQGNAVDYRYLEVNPAFEQFSGAKRDQLIGKTIGELAPGYQSVWVERFALAVERGEPARYEDYSPLLDKFYQASINPINQTICSALTMDVTDRRCGEIALRKSEAQLRRLVDSNMIGILYTDAHGHVRVANDAFLDIVGYTRADYEAGLVDWRKLTPPEYAPLDDKGIAEANLRGACTPYQKDYIRKDGTRVPILIGYACFEEADNNIIYICFIIDLSEQKQAEGEAKEYAAQLERSNRELQDFAFVASHDLQEPLRKIQAFGERLDRRLRGQLDGDSLDYLARMNNAAGRMSTMINDLLALSRVTTRGKPFQMVSLQTIAAEVLSDLEIRIERSGGQVEVEELPVIEADPTQMRQLFQNIIGNGLKFSRTDTPPRVYIRAEMSADRREVCLFFEDNGIGFEEQYLERIFQPFQRLHGAGQYEGSGIGLAVCRKIVERHSGTITANSTPGAGSTFIVILPRQQSNRRE